jgi:hypothetical protein
MRSVLCVLLLVGLFGCTQGSNSPGCALVMGIEPAIENGLAAIGGCANPAALLPGIQKAAAAVGVCVLPPSPSPIPSAIAHAMSDATSGPISLICQAVAPALIAALVPLGTSVVFPPAAQCSPAATVAMLTSGAETLCGLIPAVKRMPVTY